MTDDRTDPPPVIEAWTARALVFGASGAVLVLEILAGRMLAPYVGVSLETFTGIIGVILAGIASGAWAGGAIADRIDARGLIGPALAAGGGLAWLSLPIVRALGPEFGNGSMAIVTLATAAFFAPSAVLTAVSPMVAKLVLRDLGETGTIVGGLSAASTLGALVGTFVTGFVLVAALPTRATVLVLGAVLIVAGLLVHWRIGRALLPLLLLVSVAGTGGLAAIVTSPCQRETAYSCVNVVVDEDNASGRSLYLDQNRHAYVDLDDPTNLDIRYIRLFAQVAGSMAAGPIDTLHLGGGGFSFPHYLQHTRPGSTDLVVEIDAGLVDVAREQLGLVTGNGIEVRVGDGRLAFVGDDALTTAGYDLVIGDAFSGTVVPWHLTTREVVGEVRRVLRPGGLYVQNVIDGGANRFARAELATVLDVFDHVVVIVPPGGVPPDRRVNQIIVASDLPLPPLDIDAADGTVLPPAATAAMVDGAKPLRDDFAPVDQLLFG